VSDGSGSESTLQALMGERERIGQKDEGEQEEGNRRDYKKAT